MRKQFLEELYKSIIKQNEGYDFLFWDEVFIPVYKQELKVTVREIVKLNLLEEKVLQLIDAEVYHIDEISKVLGLKRRLLETTISELHVKNMISVSSEKCTLLSIGRSALSELESAKKSQETLTNIYVESLKGILLPDVSGYHLIEKGKLNNDNILKTNIMQDDLTTVREQFAVLDEVFSSRGNRVVDFNGNIQSTKELLTIDGVEKTFVVFIRSAISVFSSSNGYDIDIQPLNKREEAVIDLFKDEIIKQIREKRVLRDHFKYRTFSKYHYPEPVENDSIIEELKKFYYLRKKSDNAIEKMRSMVLSARKLCYGEEETIIRELASGSNSVTLIVENLDDWAYNRQFVGRLSDYVRKAEFQIIYASSGNAKKALKIIKRSIEVKDSHKENRGYYICWDFDGKTQVYGKPHHKIAIDNYTKCLVIDYYINNVPSKDKN